MHWAALISLGLLGGAFVGTVSGFAMAVLVLTLRRFENGRLVRRGEPPKKRLVLPRFHLPGAVLGGIVGGTAHVWMSLPEALTMAAVAPVVAVLLGFAIALVMGATSKR